MKNVSLVVVLACLGVSGVAQAQVALRCTSDDRLTTPALKQGRNAWARKCGYINPNREANLNNFNEYQVFANGCFTQSCAPRGNNCTYFVPASERAPCISGLVLIGSCTASLETDASHSLLAAVASPVTRYLWADVPGFLAMRPAA